MLNSFIKSRQNVLSHKWNFEEYILNSNIADVLEAGTSLGDWGLNDAWFRE